MFSLVLTVTLGLAALFLAGYAGVRWGMKSLFIFVPACALCVFGTAYSYDIAMTLFSSIVTGALTGISFKQLKTTGFIITVSTVLIAAVSSANYYYLSRVKHVDFMKSFTSELNRSVSEKAPDSAEAEVAVNRITEVISFFEKIMPAYIFFQTLVTVGIGYILLSPWLLRMKGVPPVRGIEFFRLNEYFIFVLIAAIAVTVATIRHRNSLHWFSMNVLVMAGSLYIMQALGVIKHFVLKNRIPVIVIPFVLLSLLLIGKVAILIVTAILLAGIGALDLWTDFRNLSGKRQTPSDSD
jgi:hypothetical protein